MCHIFSGLFLPDMECVSGNKPLTASIDAVFLLLVLASLGLVLASALCECSQSYEPLKMLLDNSLLSQWYLKGNTHQFSLITTHHMSTIKTCYEIPKHTQGLTWALCGGTSLSLSGSLFQIWAFHNCKRKNRFFFCLTAWAAPPPRLLFT